MGVMSTDSLSPSHPIKSDLPSPYFRSLGSQQPLSRHLNHPPKLRYFHGSMTGTEETLEGKQGGGGIVEKAFALPLVNSTYDSLASLSTPLQPYAEKGAAMMSSMGESYGAIKAGVQDKVPDAVSAKVTDAKGQVSAAVNSVDSSLCSGLDKLVDKMPALKKKTPELYNETKSSVGSFAFMATTYVASFTVVSYALKFSEFGMDGADRILKMIPGEKKEPLVSGLHWVRDETAVVRQEGAKRNGSERVLALENASLLEVLAGLLNCTYLLNLFGVPTAAVDADLPVKPVPESSTPVKGEDSGSTDTSMEEVLESRHLALDKIAASTADQADAGEELAKVDNSAIAEVHKEVKSGKDGKKGKRNK